MTRGELSTQCQRAIDALRKVARIDESPLRDHYYRAAAEALAGAVELLSPGVALVVHPLPVAAQPLDAVLPVFNTVVGDVLDVSRAELETTDAADDLVFGQFHFAADAALNALRAAAIHLTGASAGF